MAKQTRIWVRSEAGVNGSHLPYGQGDTDAPLGNRAQRRAAARAARKRGKKKR
jgi:hypothetical protein